MRFLAFNLVVAAALVYLVAGGTNGADSVSDRAAQAVTKVNEFARSAVTAGRELVTPPSPIVTAEPPKPVLAPKAEAPPTIATAIPTPPPAPSLPPDVAKRRDEVLANSPPPDRPTERPDDRRERLLKLAEQMELFHIEAVSQ